MATWLDKSPSNVPVGDQTKVNYVDIRQDRSNASNLFVGATYKNAGNWSSYVGYSADYGDTWNWSAVGGGGASGPGTSVINYIGWYALDQSCVVDFTERAGFSFSQGKTVAHITDTKLVAMGVNFDYSISGAFGAYVIDRSGTSLTHSASIFYGGCDSNQGYELDSLTSQLFAQLTFYRAADEVDRSPKLSIGLVTGASINWGNEIRVEETGTRVTTGMGMATLNTFEILVVRSDNDDNKVYLRKATVGPSTSVSQGVEYDVSNFDHWGFGVAAHNASLVFIAGSSRSAANTREGMYWLVNVAGASLITLDNGVFDSGPTGYCAAVPLTQDTGLLAYGNGTDGELRVYKISGGSVTFGLPSTSSVWDQLLRINRLDASTVLMAYNGGAAAGSTVRTHWNVVLDIDGTTINPGPITHTSSTQPYSSIQGVFDSVTAYCGFNDWEDVVNPTVFDPSGAFLIQLASTPAGGNAAKILSAEISAGGGTGYITFTDGSNIHINSYALPGLTNSISTQISSGTTEDTDAKTLWSGVRTFNEFAVSSDENTVWVFGRMDGITSPLTHLAKSTDGGATFSEIETGLGANYIGALDVEYTGTVNAIVNISNLSAYAYRGAGAIFPISQVPFKVDHRALYHSEDNYLIAGGSVDFSIKIAYTKPGAGLWYDITKNHTTTPAITGLGLV